jgi:phasin family protein
MVIPRGIPHRIFDEDPSMFSIPEQLSQAGKAAYEAHLASVNAFAQAAFDSGHTLIDLNVEAFKKSLAAAATAGGQLLAVRDPQQLSTLAVEHSQQAMERARDYGRQASELAQNSRAKFSQVADAEGATSRQKAAELVDAVKQVPASATTPINTFFKTAFAGAQEGYDHLTRSAQAPAVEPSGA